MSASERLAANAQPFLADGEHVQVAIQAQTRMHGSPMSALFLQYRAIVCTDRRILVFRCGRMRMRRLYEVLEQLPRDTVLGPAHGLAYRPEAIRTRLLVLRPQHKDIAAADALIGAPAPPADG